MQLFFLIYLILFFLIITYCDAEHSQATAVYILADTLVAHIKAKLDYAYHLKSLEDYLIQKGIYTKLAFSDEIDFPADKANKHLYLPTGGTFRMVMVNSRGEIKGVRTFDTDVDLMMEVNGFLIN